MTSSTTIIGFDNEDIVRPFTVTTVNGASTVPFDLTNYDLECDIVQVRTGAPLLHCSTNGADNRITIVDAVNGIFQITIPHGSIPYSSSNQLRFDVLAKSRSDGAYTRLFGGTVKICDGSTTPT